MIEFEAWPKTPRLFRDMIATEKIDGTNAAVIVSEAIWFHDDETPRYEVGAQSRNRLISPTDDNYGFAAWVAANAVELAHLLGPGHHFGGWWGNGIQRGYGLAAGDKRFSLFNVNRYGGLDLSAVPGLGTVPVLGQFTFDTEGIVQIREDLAYYGSKAAPGYMNPEGVVVYHTAAGQVFKVLIEADDRPKGLSKQDVELAA